MPYMKASLLEEFELPEITQEAIKQNLIKVGKSCNVKKSTKTFANLPLEEKLKVISDEVYRVLGRYNGFVNVIYDKETLSNYIDRAIKVNYLALDTETNNSLDPLTCKIMGLCLYIPNTKPVYVPINHCKPGTDELLPNQVSEKDAAEILKRLKDNNTRIIYHNGKFDIRVIKNTLGFYLPIWWDTMLASQLIDENEIAKLKTQFKLHVDPTIGTYSIDKLFTDIPYAWVDPEVFALYAAIDSYDTYKLQQYQEKLFNEPDMHKMYNLFTSIEVPTTLVVAKMEDDGIGLNIDFVNKLNAKYHKGLDDSIHNLNKYLEDNNLMPIVKAYQADGKLDDPLNFNSAPQLQILLYDIVKIPISESGKVTDKDTLKNLNHEFTNYLLQYRHYSKLITAFTEALPELRSKKDNKVHASFNQMGKEENNVRTGRFSSTNPNLQQIPSHEKVMRLMFQASEELRDIQLNNNTFELKDCEEVETTDGWKLARDLKINDILITDNSNSCIKNIINKDTHTFIIEVI